ncbi:hypothetical protein ALC53_07614 [Atta colombica]|uniref:Uncharacterized protein n=1 Tax=Atta colombica TaxID=520822 RepID=A0A151I2M4_9HYME|nr:hypothetical protein ALC53_07614 [Atta colombica]
MRTDEESRRTSVASSSVQTLTSKVSMYIRSRSSSKSKFHSHVRFSCPLTYMIEKTGRIEEDIALDRHFKPIIKPLQQIVNSPVHAIKRQSRDDDVAFKRVSETFERSATRGTRDKQKSNVDYVYDVYLHKDGLMFSNKRFMSITPKKQKNKSGKGLPHTMILNDNAIDYVHWDDSNELVNRLRLLDASHRACNIAHDNEMLSIIEELREAGLIIN